MKNRIFLLALLGGFGTRLAWSGQLEEKWSGSIHFIDNCPMSVSWASMDKETLTWDRFQQYSWQVDFQKYVDVDLADGHYVISMKNGMLNIFGSYNLIENSYKPTNSHMECGWILSSEGSIHGVGPDGTLSIDLADDCSYTIALEGALGSYEGYYHLVNDKSSQSCGYASAEGPIDKDFSDDAHNIEGVAIDRDKLAGSQSPNWSETAPGWYSQVVSEILSQVSGQAPPGQAATIAIVANAGSPVHMTSANWNLSRKSDTSDGYWAGTITYEGNWITDLNLSVPQSYPYIGSTALANHVTETEGCAITLPDDGSAASAHLYDHINSRFTQTFDGQKICRDDKPPAPYSFHQLVLGSSDADGTVQGVSVNVDTKSMAWDHKAVITVAETPPITLRHIETNDVTELDGCNPEWPVNEHIVSDWTDDFAVEIGVLLAPIECGKIMGVRSEPNRTYSWDLHFKERNPSRALNALDTSRRITKLAFNPLVLTGGTIQCRFDDKLSSSNTVPEGFSSAGSIFQTDTTFGFAASITNTGRATFQALVQAWESSTNRSDTTQTMVCTESDGSSQTRVTNSVPISFQTMVAAGLTNVVPATVSATVQGGEYRIHVEIAAPRNGHSDTRWRVSAQPGCANVPAETERRLASDHWTPGLKILDFHGTIDPTDPLTLVGEAAFDNGTIQWNLKTEVSARLVLTASATPDKEALILSWDGGPGIYLQETASLGSPYWGDIPGSAGTNTLTRPLTNSAAFYRLITR